MASVQGLKSIIVDCNNSCKSVVIFLHGLGDSGHGWSSIAKPFQGSGLETTKFVFPTAPVAPVTLNGGYPMTSWHDIVSLEEIDNENFEGLEENRKLVEELIEKEISNGIPANKIILAGFSQGAALSLTTGLRYKESLGGICALSGYLPNHKSIDNLLSENGKKTPIFVAHGTSDSVVKFEYGKRSANALKSMGLDVEFHQYPGMAHSSCDSEMTDLFNFIKKRLY